MSAVQHDLTCPDCAARLTPDGDAVHCPEGHAFTAIGLAMATNRGTVKALWAAVRALEDDAAGLEFMARKYPDLHAERRLREAAGAREAAQQLRAHADTAQRRLDSLEQDVVGVRTAADQIGEQDPPR